MKPFTLKDKSFLKRANNLGALAEVLVIALPLSGEMSQQGMVEVITPHCIDTEAALLGWKDVHSLVLIGFGDHAHAAAQFPGELMNTGGELRHNVPGRVVMNGLNGIETKAIHVVLTNPVQGIFHHEAAHAFRTRLVVIDRLAPGRVVLIGEIRPKLTQVVSFGPKVVVDHVLNDRQTRGMGGIHQSAEALRPSITGLDGVKRDSVIAPIARAGRRGHRHNLDCSNAEIF